MIINADPDQQGVPKGSILGPLLVVMCINNIPGMSHIARFILYYADDTNVQCKELPGYIYDAEKQTETQSTLL